MNRILYEAEEVCDGRLELSDRRAGHIRNVLRSVCGDVLRMGEVDGPLSSGTLAEVSEERVVLEVREEGTPPRSRLDLILALPRPKVLKRLLPQISALGVDRLVLCNASRVERFYFDTHVLRPEVLREALVEGLVQCGDTRLPRVRVIRRLRHFMEDELSEFAEGSARWLLHPYGGTPMLEAAVGKERLVLAIGPEGGWRSHEVEGFEARGFRRVGLSGRILRSDTACVAALSLAACRMERVQGDDHGGS